MKNILRNNQTFQTFLETLDFIFNLFFGEFPAPRETVCEFPMPINEERAALRRAAALFELKKRGGGEQR